MRNSAPTFWKVIREWTLEIFCVEKERPTERPRRLRIWSRICQRQRHICIAEKFAAGRTTERQSVWRNQQSIADLRDAEAIVWERSSVIKKRPTGRCDFVGIAIWRAIHAELGRTIVKTISRPVSKSTFKRLKDTVKCRTSLWPTIARNCAHGTERFRSIVRVVRKNPSGWKADLKI